MIPGDTIRSPSLRVTETDSELNTKHPSKRSSKEFPQSSSQLSDQEDASRRGRQSRQSVNVEVAQRLKWDLRNNLRFQNSQSIKNKRNWTEVQQQHINSKGLRMIEM